MAPSSHPRDAVHWLSPGRPPLPPLHGDVRADAVVIGGGMMGLMAARVLRARGREVCLLEAGRCGEGASGRSSGFITPDSELEFADLVRHFGPAEAARLWKFAWGGVDAIRQAVDGGIDCDRQVQDALFVASSPRAARTIAAEHAARREAGFPSAHYGREELPAMLGSSAYFGGIRFGDTFGIDGHRCCLGLRDRLVAAGARVFEDSAVTALDGQGVSTAAGRVRAATILACTDRLLPRLGLARREVYHAQTFLGITEPLAAAVAERIFPAGPLMVWDTDLVYRYFRLTGDRRLLVGGGTLLTTYAPREVHRPAAVARRLGRYLAERFPGLEVRFAACWPGLIGISKDFAPVIGRHPRFPSVRFAGGAAGLPWAAALGRYLAEATLDGRDDLASTLSARRHFPVGRRTQAVIRAPAAFAVSHGLLKFRS